MSFVGDDHRHTRGVGAIASMDAVSPNRRRAATRAARRMARRDVIMALGAMRRGTAGPSTDADLFPPTRPTSPVGPVIESGGSGGGQTLPPSTPPPSTTPIRTKIAQAGVAAPRPTTIELVKLPGSVITPAATTPTTPPPAPLPPLPPPKATTTIVGGGSGVAWTPPPPTTPMDIGPIEPVDIPTQPSASKQTPSKLLLYAALGLGAWWLLTRE